LGKLAAVDAIPRSPLGFWMLLAAATMFYSRRRASAFGLNADIPMGQLITYVCTAYFEAFVKWKKPTL